MSGEKTINKVTVSQYMNVINNFPKDMEKESKLTAEEKKIIEKFALCTESYYKVNPGNWKKYAWGSFNAILVIFQYLCGKPIQDAINLQNLFELFQSSWRAPKNTTIYGSNAYKFIFKENENKEAKDNSTFIKVMPDKGDQHNIHIILDANGYNKESTVEDVIQHLSYYVWPEKQESFRQVAISGFGVNLTPGGKLWKDCDKLYQAGARQIVFTGAPGTGKTYTAKKFAENMVRVYASEKGKVWKDELKTHIETVQFHSGYDYSDFVEGLRPVEVAGKDEMTFVRLDGHFKAFCRKILQDEDKNAPYFFIIDEINRADLSRVFGELMFCLDESKRPNAKEGKAEEPVKTQYSNLPTYQIDDEGNATVLKKENDVYRDGFFIPENLCILATMNDIDRSVESFDFALRRRFKWIEADANAEIENGLRGMLGSKLPDDKIKSLAEKVIAMNKVIAGAEDSKGEQLRLTAAYHIGHAYFEKYTGDNLQDIWDTQIEQILREYCRGRSNASRVDAFIDACRAALFEHGNEK